MNRAVGQAAYGADVLPMLRIIIGCGTAMIVEPVFVGQLRTAFARRAGFFPGMECAVGESLHKLTVSQHARRE